MPFQSGNLILQLLNFLCLLPNDFQQLNNQRGPLFFRNGRKLYCEIHSLTSYLLSGINVNNFVYGSPQFIEMLLYFIYRFLIVIALVLYFLANVLMSEVSQRYLRYFNFP
jgi:hypothetical protein